MAQLTDLQFVGYHDIFEDIEKALCTFSSLKETSQRLKSYGGLLGRLITLETEVNDLKRKVNNWSTDMANYVQHALNTHKAQCQFTAPSPMPSIEQELMIELIRHEAENVADAVVTARLNNLHIHIQ